MSEYPKYWKGEWNRSLGLAVMKQNSAQENSQVVTHIVQRKEEAEYLADTLITALSGKDYAALERVAVALRDQLQTAVDLTEMLDEFDKVGTDSWVWLQKARAVLAQASLLERKTK